MLAGRRAGLIDKNQEAQLLSTYRLLWRVQAATRLMGERITDPDALGESASAFLLREAGVADLGALVAQLQDMTATAAGLIDDVLRD